MSPSERKLSVTGDGLILALAPGGLDRCASLSSELSREEIILLDLLAV